MTRVVNSPPLAPSSQEGWVTPAEGIDSVIIHTWQLHCRGEVSWRAAGELHDRLNGLRDAVQRRAA